MSSGEHYSNEAADSGSPPVPNATFGRGFLTRPLLNVNIRHFTAFLSTLINLVQFPYVVQNISQSTLYFMLFGKN